MSDREAFESAVRATWSDCYPFTRDKDGEYRDNKLDGMWWGWQASRQVLSSCSEIPNSSGHVTDAGEMDASRQSLEGEPAAVINKSAAGDYEFFPAPSAASIPNGIHKLYTHPGSAVVPDKALPVNRFGVDTHYFTKNFKILIRDVGNYKPEELSRALQILSGVASDKPFVNGAGDGASVPNAEYIRALQDACDIIQADANTEQNYGSLCRIGSVLARLKSAQEKDQ